MAKRAASKANSGGAPKAPVFLLHGEDEAAMGLARTELIARLVPEELRAESVTEIAAAGTQPLRLRICLADILDELSTASFFAEQRRVAVVVDLLELTSKPTKETMPAVDRLATFLRESLAEIGNAVIFTVREDSDRWKAVQKSGPLYKAISEVGEVRHFPVENLNFAFQDAVLARDLGACLDIIDRRLEHARAADQLGVLRSQFGVLARVTRLLLQAKLLARDRGLDPASLPEDKRLNLLKQHAFVQKKITAAAKRFRAPDLIVLRDELRRANRHFAPSLEDTHVADQRLLIEHLLTMMCTSFTPAGVT